VVMNILRKNDGLSLLDLLAAMVITVIILGLASSLFLSGTTLSGEILESAQAYRNAQIVIMHLDKNTRNAASKFTIDDDTSLIGLGWAEYLEYGVYSSPLTSGELISGPAITSRYEFVANSIIYFPDKSDPSTYTTVSSHINSCGFSFNATTGDNIVVEIKIETLDNNNNSDSAYTLVTMVQAAATDSSV